MTLAELKEQVDAAIEKAAEFGQSPDEISVAIQIETLGEDNQVVFTHVGTEVELFYDGDGQASGVVLVSESE